MVNHENYTSGVKQKSLSILQQNAYFEAVKTRLFKSLLVLTFALISTGIFQNINFGTWNRYAMDLHNIIYEHPVRQVPIATVFLPRRSANGLLEAKELLPLLDSLLAHQPKIIVLSLGSEAWRAESTELVELFKQIESRGSVILQYNKPGSNRKYDDSFARFKESNFFQHVEITRDIGLPPYDRRFRRMMSRYYDGGAPFETVNWLNRLGFKIDHTSFKGTFAYLNTEQFFVKHWQVGAFGSERTDSPAFQQRLAENFYHDKIVILSYHDNWDFYSTPSNFSVLKKELDAETDMFPDAHLLAEALYSLITKDYIYLLPVWGEWGLHFIVMVLFLAGIVFLSPLRGFIMAFGLAAVFVLIDILVFVSSSYVLPVPAVLTNIFVLQYFSAPFLFYRYMSRTEREKLARERQLEQEKNKARIVAKSARADVVFRLSSQVAHDIRSPIMAVQVANEIAGDKLPTEVKRLLQEATNRLQGLANSLLATYKSDFHNLENSGEGLNLDNLLLSAKSQLQTLFPKIEFIYNNAAPDLHVGWPKFLLERALTNLLNNAVEALQLANVANPQIQLDVQLTEEQIILRLKDNGPGVAPAIRARLFQEKATFGKAGGTGLGLFQVKQTVEALAGEIYYLDQAGQGACFEIRLPQIRKLQPLKIHSQLLWIDDSEEVHLLVKNKIAANVNLTAVRTLEEAKQLIKTLPRPLTVVTDLVFQNSDSNGFDFLAEYRSEDLQRFLCTSLADHPEVEKLALEYDANLVAKTELLHLFWTAGEHSAS